MLFGKGENFSGRGKSLLRLAEDQIARRRDAADPRAQLDRIAFPDVSLLSDAEKHRKARAKRERVDNPLLGALADKPILAEEPASEVPVRDHRGGDTRFARRQTFQPSRPSVLEEFERIDAASHAGDSARLQTQMHPSQGAQSYSGSRDAGRGDWKPLIDPRYVIDAVRRLKGLLILCTALGTGLGLIKAMSVESLYYSTAEIKVDPRGLKVIDNGVTPDGFLADSFAVVDGQLGIIRSPTVLEKVAEDERLAEDPEFNGDRKSGWMEAITDILGAEDAASDKTRIAAKNLGERVFVERGAKTYNIAISAGSEDGDKAARLVGKIVDVYITEQRRQQSAVVQKTTEDLAAPLTELKAKVEAAEQKVEDFKAQNDLIGVDGRMIDDEAILRVNDQLSAAKGQTIAANARAASVKDITVKGVVDGSVPDDLNSTVLNTLRSQYSVAKQKFDGLATRLGERHPERIQANTELESIRASITTELRRVSSAMQSDLKRAIQTEQDLAARLAELKVKQGDNGPDLIALRELQRDVDVKRSVYEARLLRAGQTAEQVGLDTSSIALIVPPRAPEEPVGASRKLIVIAGALGGFGLGLALAILKGVFDSLRQQMGGASLSRREESEPTPPDDGGGMFRPNQRISVAEEVRNTLNALKTKSAPAMQQAQPAPQQATPVAENSPVAAAFVPAAAVVHAPYAAIPQPLTNPHWSVTQAPSFQPQFVANPPVQPGPMMYPYPAQMQPQTAFIPQQPGFAQQPIAQVWPQPMPQMVQMQAPSTPLHPYAQVAPHPHVQMPPPPAPAPPVNWQQVPPAPAGDARLDDIQRSIDEFRSALNDFAWRRGA